MIHRFSFPVAMLIALLASVAGSARAGTGVTDITLEPKRSFIDLPTEWDRPNTSPGRWSRYGAQPKTSEEIRQESLTSAVHAVHQLVYQNKHAEALARLREIDAQPGKTVDDVYLIERTRLAIASRIGDKALITQCAQAIVATGRAPAAEQLAFVDLLARTYYNQRNYAQAIPWLVRYFKEGGTDTNLRDGLVKAYYLNNDFAQAAAAARSAVEVEEKAGRTPPEDLFKVWFRSAFRLNDQPQYVVVMEKTVTYYPKKEYWADLLNRLISKPGFSDALSFDAYRFMYETGQIISADDYVEMAQAALQSGYAGQARRVLEQGYQTGVLGHGPRASAHRQLRDAVVKAATEQARKLEREAAAAARDRTGDKLVDVGERFVDQGEIDKGIVMMNKGIALGGLKKPDEARLHLGIACILAGRMPDALQAWRQVQGNNGSADLARYWRLYFDNESRGTASAKTSG